MATTFTFYNIDKKHRIDNSVDLLNDTLKVSLHTSTYTPDKDADTTTANLSNELAASGNYTTGGVTVTNPAATVDNTNDRGVFDADDPSWTALTPSAPFRYGVLYSSTGSELIGWWNFGANQDPGGSNFAIQTTAAASGGWFNIV